MNRILSTLGDRMRALCLRCALALCLTGSLAFAQSAADDSATAAIRSVLTRQAIAWNAGNIDEYMQGYRESDSLLFTSGGRIQRGWKATLEKYKTSYAGRSRMGRLTFSSVEVNMIGQDCAWVFGRWDITRDPDPAGGVFTLVFQRFGDGWKIVHDHTSVDPPDSTIRKP